MFAFVEQKTRENQNREVAAGGPATSAASRFVSFSVYPLLESQSEPLRVGDSVRELHEVILFTFPFTEAIQMHGWCFALLFLLTIFETCFSF